jgi:hypothetical protein
MSADLEREWARRSAQCATAFSRAKLNALS